MFQLSDEHANRWERRLDKEENERDNFGEKGINCGSTERQHRGVSQHGDLKRAGVMFKQLPDTIARTQMLYQLSSSRRGANTSCAVQHRYQVPEWQIMNILAFGVLQSVFGTRGWYSGICWLPRRYFNVYPLFRNRLYFDGCKVAAVPPPSVQQENAPPEAKTRGWHPGIPWSPRGFFLVVPWPQNDTKCISMLLEQLQGHV